MEKLILFDIDDTLINLKLVHRLSLLEFMGTISSATMFKKNIQQILKLFVRNINPTLETLNGIFGEHIYTKALFEDTLPCLDRLKVTATLGIFSAGENTRQYIKLKQSGILHYFSTDHTYIFPHKTKHLDFVHDLQKKYDLYFVDNRLDIVTDLQNENLNVIHINRDSRANKQTKAKQPVSTLTEVANILDRAT